jgi:hypothetical protein
MNQKRDVVTRYFKEAPPKVKAAFEKYRPTDRQSGRNSTPSRKPVYWA